MVRVPSGPTWAVVAQPWVGSPPTTGSADTIRRSPTVCAASTRAPESPSPAKSGAVTASARPADTGELLAVSPGAAFPGVVAPGAVFAGVVAPEAAFPDDRELLEPAGPVPGTGPGTAAAP